jgi:Zn-dependent membrane protease YugP
MELIEIVLIIIIIFLPLIAQIKVKSSYKKYSKIKCNKDLKGKDVARMILDRNGLNNISIEEISGTLSDHYNPKSKSISLSTSIYEDNSISSFAVAAHECGHAIQDKEAYSYFNLRSSLVPIVNVTSKISSIFIIIGFVSEYVNLIDIGIILLCCGLFFQLVTLPVEFNASNRAKVQLQELGLISKSETTGIKKVLFAAALTYVAGFLSQALQVLRLILISRRRR